MCVIVSGSGVSIFQFLNLLVSCKIRDLTICKLKYIVVLRLQSRYLAVEKDHCFKSLSLLLTQLCWRDVAISFFRSLKNLDWRCSIRGMDGLPHSCCQLLHRSFALFCFLLWAPQDVPQLLQVVQRSHQLTFHCLHLTLQHLCVMQRIPPVASAGAHLFL